MTDWSEVAMTAFSCVAANHLGLVAAIEKVIRRRLPIINCPKCLTFWSLIGYGVFAHEKILVSIATSLLFAYLATWLELGMGYIDTLYIRLYETIYPDTANDTPAATDSEDDTDSAVSQL